MHSGVLRCAQDDIFISVQRGKILHSEVAEAVDRLLKQARQAGFEVSILAYPHVDAVAETVV